MNKASDTKALLEVIVCSVADAIAAEAGGADRLEIISHFAVGGLTPDLSRVREVLQAVRIPVRVMLRESETFQVDDPGERRKILQIAGRLNQMDIDGIVCGFLWQAFRRVSIDHGMIQDVITAAPDKKITFHRAFEEMPDPASAIDSLKQYPQIDRILTSGGPGTETERIACLNLCDRMAGPEITILAGGGLDEGFVRRLRAETAIREIHIGKIAREPVSIDGVVSAERVKGIVSMLRPV